MKEIEEFLEKNNLNFFKKCFKCEKAEIKDFCRTKCHIGMPVYTSLILIQNHIRDNLL